MVPGTQVDAGLDAVLRTIELTQRSCRPPDVALQCAAQERLIDALARDPAGILDVLCEVTQKVCDAGSAGVSLLTPDGASFYWPAITGAWRSNVGSSVSRDFGPCGIVIERNATQLFEIRGGSPAVVEALLAPFHVNGRAVGTVWALSHDPQRRFDAEDRRQLEGIARFAAAAYQTLDGARKLQHEVDRVQTVLAASEIATWIWEIDADRVYADANLALLFNVNAEAAAGGPLGDYLRAVHVDDRPGLRNRIATLLAGTDSDFEAEYRVTGADGRMRWVAARGRLQRSESGQPARLPGVIIDITARKRSEDALVEADQRKNEFLAMLSHELRNPLASISNSIQLLEMKQGAEHLPEIVGMMRRQSSHMIRLIEDLLDVGRVSTGKIQLRLERLQIATIIRQAIEANRPMCDRQGHSLTVSLPADPVYVLGDATRLTQVVGNLLNNACKFTNRGGRISVSVLPEGQCVAIRVRDNGIGMTEAQLTRVFELFAQADTSLGRSESGLGIGLTLVKKLVEMHDGAIAVESAGLGQGSQFTVTLQLAAFPL